MSHLPFACISDHELFNLLDSHEITNPDILPLEILHRMIFNQFTTMHDRYETDSDTEDFLLNALKLKNLDSKYLFPEYPSYSTSSRNDFSVISFNIRSIPRQFDTFIVIPPSPHLAPSLMLFVCVKPN